MTGTTKGINGVFPLDTDSGWETAGTLGTGWTADTYVARRYGALVTLVIKNLDYDTGGSTAALTLKEGFRPDYDIEFLASKATTTPVVAEITAAGVVTIPVTDDNVEVAITYMTSNPFPA